MGAYRWMFQPGAKGVGEILTHVVFDGAAHLAVQLRTHCVFDKCFHDPVVTEDSRPDTVSL